jgi:membrane-bound lytic murein transglycosylase F
MSKKTIIFSIVLIIVATYLGSAILLDEETVTKAEKSHTLAEMATTKVADEQMQQWIISSYDDMMQRISKEEGQDWLLMSAIAYRESRSR